MEQQLHLIELEAPEWRVDPPTREVGLRGLRGAREALRRARARTERGDGPNPKAA